MQGNQNNRENKHNIELISSDTLIKILRKSLIVLGHNMNGTSIKKIENADFEEFLAKLKNTQDEISQPYTGSMYNIIYAAQKSPLLKVTDKKIKISYDLYIRLSANKLLQTSMWKEIKDCFKVKAKPTFFNLNLQSQLSLIPYYTIQFLATLLYLTTVFITMITIAMIMFIISIIPIVVLSTVAPTIGGIIGILCLIGQGFLLFKPMHNLIDKFTEIQEDVTTFLQDCILTKKANKYLNAPKFFDISWQPLKSPNEQKLLTEIQNSWYSWYFWSKNIEKILESCGHLGKYQQQYENASRLQLSAALEERYATLTFAESDNMVARIRAL